MLRTTPSLSKLWIPLLLGRLTSLLFIFSFFVLYFYAVGNAQGFADKTLFFLFSLESWILGLTVLTGTFSTLTYAVTAAFGNRLKMRDILFSAVAVIMSLLLYLGLALLRALMRSYGGA